MTLGVHAYAFGEAGIGLGMFGGNFETEVVPRVIFMIHDLFWNDKLNLIYNFVLKIPLGPPSPLGGILLFMVLLR